MGRVWKAAAVVAALVLGGGCSGRQAGQLEAWVEEQRAHHPSITFEAQYGLVGIIGGLVTVEVGSLTEARSFSDDLAEQWGTNGSGRFSLRVTWPVTGGSTTLRLLSRHPAPDDAWAWADEPLPAGATERRVGWTRGPYHGPERVEWSRLIEYQATMLAATLAAATLREGVDYAVYDIDSRYTGAFPGPQVAERARVLARFEPHAQMIQGELVTLSDEADLTTLAEVRSDLPWTLRQGGNLIHVGAEPVDTGLFRQLTDAGLRVTLLPGRVELHEVPAEVCAGTLDSFTTQLQVGIGCRGRGHHVWIVGDLPEVRASWAVLDHDSVRRLPIVRVEPDQITVRMDGLAEADRPAVLARLRQLPWQGERVVEVTADRAHVRFTSTQEGTARGARNPDTAGRALLAAWDESAS